MQDTGELDALLVRNIGDLESAIAHAKTSTDTAIWRELADSLGALFERRDWFLSSDIEKPELWFARRTWLRPDTHPQEADAWFSIDEFSPDGDGDETWVAEFLGAGPSGSKVALFFRQDILTKGSWKRLVKAHASHVSLLGNEGFTYDGSSGEFYKILALDAETLAKGFEEESLVEAMKPVSDAAVAAGDASSVFDELIKAARAEASI